MTIYEGNFEPEEGKPETASRMNAAKFLQERGIKTKGHPLCWHTQCAKWLMEYDNKTILKKQLDRITREVTQFRGVIDGAWLGAPSGVIRRDNSVKPVYNRLKEMIKGEWWTDCEIRTDANGCVEIEGVRGDYEVRFGEKRAALKLAKDTPGEIVVRI